MTSSLPDDSAQSPQRSQSQQRDSKNSQAFAFEELSWSINRTQILHKLTETIPSGQVTALIGPNGSGKSSLLRILAGVTRPDTGSLEAAGKDWAGVSSKIKAKTLAYVEQNATPDRSLTVRDVVLLGRMPHRSLLAGPTATDLAIARDMLDHVGLTDFADREFGTLSGGERQRTLIAKALAQQTDILVVDEPTNHLDIAAQLSALSMLRDLSVGGVTVLTALHDLNLAATFCDQVIVMDHGRFVSSGPPNEVLTEELIRKVYGVESLIMRNPRTGKPLIVFG